MLSSRKRCLALLAACGATVATVGLAANNVPTSRPGQFLPGPRRPTGYDPGRRVPTPVRPAPAAPGKPATPGNAPRPAMADRIAAASDDDKEVLIVQALEQPTTLKIENTPIPQAVRLLSEKTGVPIEFDRFVLGCLPYGSKTQVTAVIENRPLRETLDALLQPLASKYVLAKDRLVIQPRPALFRICRRATWDEVVLIQKLYSTPWTKELADSLQFQFQDMSSADAEANRRKIYDLAGSVGAGHAARVLEYACQQYGWEWHPEGKAISFCTRARQIELQLQRPVTAQYSEMQLKDVLLDLAGRAGVLLKMESGVLASLPTHLSERFRLTLENVTIRQALELIAGETGLAYFVEQDGIRIANNTFATASAASPSPETIAQAAALARSSNPVVGQITLPGQNGMQISFFIREQDLSPELNQLRQDEIRKLAASRIKVALSRPAE